VLFSTLLFNEVENLFRLSYDSAFGGRINLNWDLEYMKWYRRYHRARFAYFKWKTRKHFSFGPGCDIYTPAITFDGWGNVIFDEGCFLEKGGLGVHFTVGWGGRVRFGPRMWIRTWYQPNVFCCDPGGIIEIGADSMVSGIMIRVKKEVKIGKRFLGAYGSRILDSDFHDLDNDTPEKSAPIVIGDYVWLCSDVTVLAGVHIGDHAVIGAGSIVTDDIPDHVFAVGRPAKPVKSIGDRTSTR